MVTLDKQSSSQHNDFVVQDRPGLELAPSGFRLDAASLSRDEQVFARTPTTPWGFACLWPQFEEWRDYKRVFAHYYHNSMI